MIDGRKMSASLGNVVYPKDWVAVATPELLRFFYNKRLMKTRSFSWKDLPKLYEEYQRAEAVFYGVDKLDNEREEEHTKRLYELSQIGLKKKMPLQMPFRLVSMAVQIFGADTKKVAAILKRTGHLKGPFDEKRMKDELKRIKNWAENYGPDEYRIGIKKKISDKIKKKLGAKRMNYLADFGRELEKTDDVKKLCRSFIKQNKIPAKEFFASVYLALFGSEQGPRLADFIEVYGRKKVARILKGLA
jgi:lysyl-tRNA synthetase class 1